MIYQTEMTKAVLAQIEEVSRVKWNSGDLPTEYWSDCYDREAYLSISAESFQVLLCTTVEPMSLFLDRREEDRIMCTAEEFVDHCKRMKPRE
jgi:hypothetical protein